MNSLAKKRANYYAMVYNYIQRREQIRKKFPHLGVFPMKRDIMYNRAVYKINKKIKLWNRQIKNIDMISNKIIALGNIVAIFTGINPKGLGKAGKDQCAQRTLMIFFRKGIELGIEQKLLREYVGMKRIKAPAEYRMKHLALTNANKTLYYNHKAYIEWKNFQQYYNEFPVSGSDFTDKRRSPGA